MLKTFLAILRLWQIDKGSFDEEPEDLAEQLKQSCSQTSGSKSGVADEFEDSIDHLLGIKKQYFMDLFKKYSTLKNSFITGGMDYEDFKEMADILNTFADSGIDVDFLLKPSSDGDEPGSREPADTFHDECKCPHEISQILLKLDYLKARCDLSGKIARGMIRQVRPVLETYLER